VQPTCASNQQCSSLTRLQDEQFLLLVSFQSTGMPYSHEWVKMCTNYNVTISWKTDTWEPCQILKLTYLYASFTRKTFCYTYRKIFHLTYYILAAMLMMIQIFGQMTPCQLANHYQYWPVNTAQHLRKLLSSKYGMCAPKNVMWTNNKTKFTYNFPLGWQSYSLVNMVREFLVTVT
jgi:hypothetical protein